MVLTAVKVVSVPVSDQERARDFYVESLGFVVLSDTVMGPEMRWVMVAPAGSHTALTLVTWFPSMPAGSLKGLVLETDDLDGDSSRLKAAGVAVSALQEAPWGRFVQFDDPDGNGIVLQESAPMDGR
jgi:catechol 2,3-dioxygenase-like lactoylglutathione lyase family enzyme